MLDGRIVNADAFSKGGRCRTNICASGCYGESRWEFRGPAKYLPCQDAYEDFLRMLDESAHEGVRSKRGRGWREDGAHPWAHPKRESCDSQLLRKDPYKEKIRKCPECIDGGNTFEKGISNFWGCKLSPENVEKKRKECDRLAAAAAAEKKNQCLAQPALGSSLWIDGVDTTSFALGALVTCTLGVVVYFVRRARGTKITDSRAYGATAVQ